jgi:hypothetical protein
MERPEQGVAKQGEHPSGHPPTAPGDSDVHPLTGVGALILILTVIVGTILRYSGGPWKSLSLVGSITGLTIAALGYVLHWWRKTSVNQAAPARLIASDLPAPSGGFRRADFEARAEELNRVLARSNWMLPLVLAPILVGLPALMAIDSLRTDEPPSFVGLFILMGISGVAAAAYLARATRAARRLGLLCSACRLVFATRKRHGPHFIDVVLETGKCPGCGKQLLNEVEVGPRHNPRENRYAPLWFIGTLLVIAGACVASYLITSALWRGFDASSSR